ncbi:MAG: hypothetical protein ABR507_11975 [Actinomycetota bacterium]
MAYLALVVMPSSLNLPQSNPQTVLEYAPVPPSDNNNPPPSSNGLSTLGLGTSAGLGAGDASGNGAGGTGTKGKSVTHQNISLKCVANHQTEDPNSPPCQPYFQGDNGGATYQGVTKNDINVLIYQETVITQDSNRVEASPNNGTYCNVELMDCDGDGKQDPDPHVWIRVANAFDRYFNSRYQTYGRHVNVWFYWSNGTTEAARRSNAVDNWKRLHPFAVIDEAWNGGFHEAYADSMAHLNTMVFASYVGQPRSFYQKYAPKVWSFWPDIENWSDGYISYVCNKIATQANAQDGDFAGKRRRYALYYSSDEGYPELATFAGKVKDGVAHCSSINPKAHDIHIESQDTYTFPYSGWAVDTNGDRSYAEQNCTQWKSATNAAGSPDPYTTILWAGGSETDTSKACGKLSYRPEWIVAGDGLIDANAYAQVQDQDSWSSAWTQSYQLRTGRLQDDPSFAAYKEAEPDGQDAQWAQSYYRDWFMLFQSIQVAGPRLNPQSVDKGLHAIQRRQSTSPYVAAGYFLPGDYTYVKDGNEMWYDKTGLDPNGNQGCYRLVNGGNRFDYQSWGSYAEDPKSGAKSGALSRGMGSSLLRDVGNDPCTGYTNSQGIRPGTPAPPGG